MPDDLPVSTGSQQVRMPSSAPTSVNKEVLNAPFGTTESPAPKEIGQEAVDTLPKEVTSAGVTMQPTTIPVPSGVAKMGVQPVGANIPMPNASTPLPITDDQIAQGLGKSVRESFRWLAEWCIRRLKQVHVGLQSVRGKLVRVEIK